MAKTIEKYTEITEVNQKAFNVLRTSCVDKFNELVGWVEVNRELWVGYGGKEVCG